MIKNIILSLNIIFKFILLVYLYIHLKYIHNLNCLYSTNIKHIV